MIQMIIYSKKAKHWLEYATNRRNYYYTKMIATQWTSEFPKWRKRYIKICQLISKHEELKFWIGYRIKRPEIEQRIYTEHSDELDMR